MHNEKLKATETQVSGTTALPSFTPMPFKFSYVSAAMGQTPVFMEKSLSFRLILA